MKKKWGAGSSLYLLDCNIIMFGLWGNHKMPFVFGDHGLACFFVCQTCIIWKLLTVVIEKKNGSCDVWFLLSTNHKRLFLRLSKTTKLLFMIGC